MSKKRTYVTFLLDETGSMMSHRDQTISAFNEYLGTLQGQEGAIRCALTLFNSESTRVVYNGVPVAQVAPLNADTYQPQATTPLYDAIMGAVRATEEAVAERKKTEVFCVILTDGLENASREHTRDDVFATIRTKTAAGWTFVYLGADQDAWEIGQGLGIARGNTASFSKHKIAHAMKAVGEAMGKYTGAAYLKREPIEDFFAEVDPDALND